MCKGGGIFGISDGTGKGFCYDWTWTNANDHELFSRLLILGICIYLFSDDQRQRSPLIQPRKLCVQAFTEVGSCQGSMIAARLGMRVSRLVSCREASREMTVTCRSFPPNMAHEDRLSTDS